MTGTEHIKSHKQEHSHHVQARIAQKAFESILLGATKRAGSIVHVKHVVAATLMANGEHHVQCSLLGSCSLVDFLNHIAGTQSRVTIEKTTHFGYSE